MFPAFTVVQGGRVDFELIADSIPHIVWEAGPDGSTEYFNRFGTAFTGLPAEANYGWGWLSLIHSEDVERAQREWEQASAAGLELQTEWRVRRADGAYRWLAIRGVPLRDAAGAVWRWVGTCTDIEDAKQQEAELRRSQQESAESLALLEALQATAPVGFAFIDPQFRVVRINETLAAVSRLPIEEQIGRPVAEVVPAVWPELEPVYRAVLEQGETVVGREIATPSARFEGAIRHWLCSFHPVQVEGEVAGIGVVASDITERKQAEEFRSTVMGNMAEGVYALDSSGKVMFMNRAASQMLGWTDDELRGKSMHCIIHFQNADGTPHHECECALLRVRTEAHYERVAEDTFTRKDGTTFPVSYSAAPLLDINDGNGAHGVVIVFRDVSEELAERHRVERELASLAWVGRIRDALDDDRFVLYSQPIVALGDAKDREELLLRMIGHDGELVPPASFLPAAEKYGLIKEIDRWVIRMAIRHAADGRCVHANLSAASIGDPDLLRLIEDELNSTGADPARLTFELTETAVLNDVETGVRFTTSITALGCRLALDDFGTGFGSFTYLKRLPLSSVKIDREFVQDLTANDANQHLVRVIVGLAQGFGYETIAEGVEDEATLDVLRSLGVDYAQGFLFGRPAPTGQPEAEVIRRSPVGTDPARPAGPTPLV